VRGEKRGPACHRSPSAEPRTVETVKTCAVLTPSLGRSLDPVMARVQEPSNSNLGNCAETFALRPTPVIFWNMQRRGRRS
jgi:hypothetical protein